MIHFGHMTGDDASDADIDYDEAPNGAVGITDLGGWKVSFGLPPGPSGKACADPTTTTCP